MIHEVVGVQLGLVMIRAIQTKPDLEHTHLKEIHALSVTKYFVKGNLFISTAPTMLLSETDYDLTFWVGGMMSRILRNLIFNLRE